MFEGSMVAMITPFVGNWIDDAAVKRLVEWHISAGTTAIVVAGTTGESPALTHQEQRDLISGVVGFAAQRIPVIAGTGSNSTAETISLTKHAASVGADAALVVTPYYNRPSQAGLYAHYKQVHDEAAIPIIIYNIPFRTGIEMSIDTMASLAELPRIVGVKDSTHDLSRPLRERAKIGADFALISGDDTTCVPYLAQGGTGCISVAANLVPDILAQLHNSWKAGNVARVQELNSRLLPLYTALSSDASPGPVKYGASLLGLCSDFARMPMTPVSTQAKDLVKSALKDLSLGIEAD